MKQTLTWKAGGHWVLRKSSQGVGLGRVRTQWREPLASRAAGSERLADPTGNSGAGAALQNCPRWRQWS